MLKDKLPIPSEAEQPPQKVPWRDRFGLPSRALEMFEDTMRGHGFINHAPPPQTSYALSMQYAGHGGYVL